MAPNRLRLYDFIHSRGPAALGICASDTPGCANIVNASQQRLIFAKETSDTGPMGAWAEIAFNVSQADPFFTTPRGTARIINLDLCTWPVPVQNGFFEYLQFGAGRYPKTNCLNNACNPLQVYSRGWFPTLTDIPAGRVVRVRPTNVADESLRSLISGIDNNNQKVTNLDGPVLVQGEFVSFTLPFADTVTPWNRIDAIQKDVTIGPVSFYSVDLTTGDEDLLATMEPGETVASYQRYYLGGLPKNCCSVPDADANTVQVTAMVKLDFIPVVQPTDFLLIQNLEALIAECQAVRYSEMDSPGSMTKSAERHREAIRLLNGELAHFMGKEMPAINFAPFGSAKLRNQRIGQMI